MDQDRINELQRECEREPIRVPGLIQPFGALIVVDEARSLITHASENGADFFGHAVDSLIGKPISDLFPADELAIVERYLSFPDVGDQVPLGVNLPSADGHSFQALNLSAHRSHGRLILEFEKVTQRRLKGSFVSFNRTVKNSVLRLQRTESLQELCDCAVESVREITGFGRVMIYRFDPEWNGKVISESIGENEDSYFGHYFPASDIPAQARAIFLENWLRMIPDAQYAPVSLVPRTDSTTANAVDLGCATLRSVSPIHLEYLKNMGVGASLTISLVDEEKLWGLIACHDRQAHYVDPEDRLACQLIGQLVSSQIRVKEEREDLAYKSQLKRVHAQLLEYMASEEDLVRGLVKYSPNMLDIANAEGAAAAIYFEGQWTLVGRTPSIEQIEGIVSFLRLSHPEALFATDRLPTIYPPAREFKEMASGLLALSIPKSDRNYLLWFRPEVVSTVTWAGNPSKAVDTSASGPMRLHPRKSFEAWKEVLTERSLPWRSSELEAVQELRNSILAIDLHRQFIKEQIARAKAEKLSREKDDIVAIVSHDLKSPLAAIKLSFDIIKKAMAKGDTTMVDTVLQRMMSSAGRMERLIYDLLDISKIDAGTFTLEPESQDVESLVTDAVEMFHPVAANRGVQLIADELPVSCRACCEKDRVLQVLSNLIGNAIKFTPTGGQVRVGVESCEKEVKFVVADTGFGIPPESLEKIFDRFWQAEQTQRLGTGLGLSIAKGIVTAHGGRIWAESEVGRGTKFYFTIPSV